MYRLFLLGLLTVAPASSWGQGPTPGVAQDTLTWERVGDRPVKPRALAFDGAGVLYARRSLETFVLDLSAGFPGVWVERYFGNIGAVLLGLGADTLLAATPGTTNRSTDGGLTWSLVYDGGTPGPRALIEAPPGTPMAGDLLLGYYSFAVSPDRGQTWEQRGYMPGEGNQIGFAEALAALASGRLVAGGGWGAAYSDDDGHTWTASSLWAFLVYFIDFVAVAERPSGGQRVVALGSGPWTRNTVWYSDDEGQTWLPEGGMPFVPPATDVGSEKPAGLVWVGGSTVLAVMGWGTVYRSDDGGATWAEVGRVPDVSVDVYAAVAVVGPDGRLYVGLRRRGHLYDGTWVHRTTEPVPVSAEPEPVEVPEGLGLSVRPNPAQGRAEVVVTLVQPAAVEAVLYDALGRRVAVMHSGLLGAGEHTLTFDGASLPVGVYVVRVKAGDAVASQRLTLVR